MFAVNKEINNIEAAFLSLRHKSYNLRPVLPNANSSMADGVFAGHYQTLKKLL